jgi:hypothetical protein
MATPESKIPPYLHQILALDFVTEAHDEKHAKHRDIGVDGILKLRNPERPDAKRKREKELI